MMLLFKKKLQFLNTISGLFGIDQNKEIKIIDYKILKARPANILG